MINMSYNHCIFYVAGLLVVYAYDDISYNKIATQSHTFTGVGYDATNAVDGNIATCTRAKEIGLNSPDKTVWWKVDLGGIFNIYSINILFKNYDGFDIRQRGRIAGFSLFVSKTGDIQGATLCYKDGPQLPPLNFTTICLESGRYVIFYNERLDGATYPDGYKLNIVITELCEVTVQGCDNASFYGTNCDTPCPINCKDNTCHIQSGSCFKCKPGWSGMYCNTKCKEEWYGHNCTKQCVGHCTDGITCNHVTGQCDRGCDAGWTGSLCDKACTKGYFGTNCSRVCSPNCKSDTCLHTDGSCTECVSGWKGYNCTTACVQSYGGNCMYPCAPHCYNQTCDRFNGWCVWGCKNGFYGEMCERGTIESRLIKQDKSQSICLVIGLSISILINLILISCGILLCRRSKQSNTTSTNSVLFCRKKFIYQDTFVKKEEVSTYQELDLSGSVYQNPTRR